MKKQLFAGLILIAFLAHPFSAFGGLPLDTLKGNVEKVLDILKDPSIKGKSAMKIRKDRIRSISNAMFDFSELSKRTLGHNWNKFTKEQQEEFVHLYRSLLESVYADRIMSYANEKIIFNGENPLSEKTVEVETTVVTKKADVPIHYRMIQKEGYWRVYDVVIEGVSLINNYRTQFREILSRQTPESLLDTLRRKTADT
jgi:phospholipid transport system substrate-binding protein